MVIDISQFLLVLVIIFFVNCFTQQHFYTTAHSKRYGILHTHARQSFRKSKAEQWLKRGLWHACVSVSKVLWPVFVFDRISSTVGGRESDDFRAEPFKTALWFTG